MRPITVYFGALLRRLVKFEPYAIEIVLSLSSLWASWVLLSGGTWSDAINSKSAIAFADSLGPETYWGGAALIGGTAKIIGLLLIRTRFISAALALRVAGLGISAAFWIIIGFCVCYGNPESVVGGPVILLGVWAWWLMLRLPALPDSVSPFRK
jgi:hypothetical protein